MKWSLFGGGFSFFTDFSAKFILWFNANNKASLASVLVPIQEVFNVRAAAAAVDSAWTLKAFVENDAKVEFEGEG